MVLPGRFLIKKNFYKVMCRKDEVKMASKDWKLPDAQHKITEEKGLDPPASASVPDPLPVPAAHPHPAAPHRWAFPAATYVFPKDRIRI